MLDMYHFSIKNNNCDDYSLSQNTLVTKNIAKYLTNFQLSAIKFLYKNFETHKACILNDESGLGKTASVSVFLNLILGNKNEQRKCLIICKKDDRITNWKFHFDILTNLTYKVVFNENEIDDKIVYLTKWDSLRSSASLANYKFDCIIVDNRDNLMANKICLAYLLRNYENKISLVIDNQDVTIDLKEFHSILRLCGRLEQKYRDFKVFEEKFELPLVTGCSSDNQKILESYFLRREKILNYCKEFCLRRYRHQFESQLPLVSPNVYRLNLKKWEDAPAIARVRPVHLDLDYINLTNSLAERDTEDLHNSYINKINNNKNETAKELLDSFFSRREEDEFNKEICQITTTIHDDTAVEQSTEVMSPLIFLPDENELSNNDDYVSSTTKDENEIRIVQPTPIHVYKKPEPVPSTSKINKIQKVTKINRIESETSSMFEDNGSEDNNDDDEEPKIVRVTRLTPRSKKDKATKSGYKELKISRVSTRGQDRVTRSQAHKNKYLTLNLENTIEKGKREIDNLFKRKKQTDKTTKKPSNTTMRKSKIAAYNKLKQQKRIFNVGSSQESTTNISDSTYLDDDFHELVDRDKCNKDTLVLTPNSPKKSQQIETHLSGLSILDDEQNSEQVHLIESTPELIVLSSSTDSSIIPIKNKNQTFVTIHAYKLKTPKQNKTIASPDIFGSAVDDSFNIICSQKSNLFAKQKVNSNFKTNIKQNDSPGKKYPQNETPKDKIKISTQSEVIESTEKNEKRNRYGVKQKNKITKYLKTDTLQDTEIVSSSSQSSNLTPPTMVCPKTPKKKKRLNTVDSAGGSSATKPSPRGRISLSGATPTKSSNALTKWLIKPNSKANESTEKSDKKSKEDESKLRETRSIIGKKRRRLDLSFKD